MKLIIAVIQPSKLEDVKAALNEVEVVRLTIMDVQGFGRQKGHTELYRGREITVNLLRKVQLQIAVNEALMRLRRDRRTAQEIGVEDMTVFVEDHAPLPPAAADAAILQRALAALPATTRSVLWLYHAEGYTHDEIATLMQRTATSLSAAGVKARRRVSDSCQIPPTTLTDTDAKQMRQWLVLWR